MASSSPPRTEPADPPALQWSAFEARMHGHGVKKIAAMARLAGVDAATLFRIRDGAVPTLPVACRLADISGMTLDDLVGRPRAPRQRRATAA